VTASNRRYSVVIETLGGIVVLYADKTIPSGINLNMKKIIIQVFSEYIFIVILT